MAFMIKRTGSSDYPRFLKVLVMGPPKSGKTTFVSTAPNCVVLAAEAGLMSVAHLNMAYVDVEGSSSLDTMLQILKDDTLRLRAAQKVGLPKIESVAIDTLDALQEIMKKEILKENRRTEMQQADWGKLKERMAVMIKAYAALPMNVIFTVHTTVTQDEEARQIYAPGLQGSIKDDLAGYVDFSLLSFRQKETDANGNSAVHYYLKNEGDLKNPHVGNRSAGRVPEICEPSFKLLHDLTFSGIDLAPTHMIDVETSEPEASAAPAATSPAATSPAATSEPEKAAQSVSQSAPAAATTTSSPAPAATPPPSGVPADNTEKPINAAGVSMLTKEYQALAWKAPEDMPTWTLSKGRNTAKLFVAAKGDIAATPEKTKEVLTKLVEDLKAADAFAGVREEKGTPVETKADRKKRETAEALGVTVTPPTAPVDGLTQAPPAEAAPLVQGETAPPKGDSGEAAVSLVEEQLGGVVIGRQIAPDAKCEVCGNEIDDVEIAQLGLTRFQKVLCLDDYKIAAKK